MAAGDAAARVLVVCEGNLCRSPAAELLLRKGLGPDTAVLVSSAGTAARVGEPVAEPMLRLLQARGMAADGTARQLTPELVAGADLVLTMTAAQRAVVASRVPAAVRRTFMLREFAALAELVEGPRDGDPARRLTALVAGAGRARALRGPHEDDDIPDPYGCSAEVYADALVLIEDAVDRLLAELPGPAGEPVSPRGAVDQRVPVIGRAG